MMVLVLFPNANLFIDRHTMVEGVEGSRCLQ